MGDTAEMDDLAAKSARRKAMMLRECAQLFIYTAPTELPALIRNRL